MSGSCIKAKDAPWDAVLVGSVVRTVITNVVQRIILTKVYNVKILQVK